MERALVAGSKVKALDFTPSGHTAESTTQANQTNTSYAYGTPNCSLTFMAPTTGRVVLTVGAGMRDNSGSNRVFVAPEIREDDASGLVVLDASAVLHGVTNSVAGDNYEYHSRTTIVEGLNPGAIYLVRAMHRVSGGSSADVGIRILDVSPAY